MGQYESGDIPNAILTEKYVFLLTVGVLPDTKKDSFENFDENNQNWYNDKSRLGEIRWTVKFDLWID